MVLSPPRALDHPLQSAGGDRARAGIEFDLGDVCEIFRRTPYIAT